MPVIRALLAVAVLFLASTSTFADAFELLPRTIGISAGNKSQPAIATNGNGYLVAWLEGDDDEREIRATRVSATGEVLDPMGIRVATGAVAPPEIISNGDEYLIAWSWGCDDYCPTFAVRISRDGRLLDTTPRRVGAIALAVAPLWDGNRYLILTKKAGIGLVGQFFDRELNPVSETFIASRWWDFTDTSSFDARFDGTNFVIVFQSHYRRVQFSSVNLTILDREGHNLVDWKLIADHAYRPRIGRIGDKSLVGWSHAEGVSLATIDADGSIIPGRTTEIRSARDLYVISDSPGTGASVVLNDDGGEVIALQFDANLQQLLGRKWVGTPVALIDANGSGVSATGGSAVWFRVIGGTGDTLLSQAPSRQFRPRMAWDGRVFVGAWVDQSLTGPPLRFARFDRDGRTLDAEGIGVPVDSDSEPRIGVSARDGLSFIAWESSNVTTTATPALFAMQVDSSGSIVLPPALLETSACDSNLAVAASRSHFLVLTEDCQTKGLHVVASARRTGQSAGSTIAAAAARHGYDIACGEAECLAAIAIRGEDATWRLQIQRMSSDGLPIGSMWVGAVNAMAPSIASDGSRFFIAYTDTATTEIKGLLVDETTTSSPVLLSLAGDAGYGAEVTFTGRGYSVLWQRLYSSPATMLLRPVALDGQPLTGAEEIASTAKSMSLLSPEHAVASSGNGEVFAVWTRHPYTLDVAASRLWGLLRREPTERRRLVRR